VSRRPFGVVGEIAGYNTYFKPAKYIVIVRLRDRDMTRTGFAGLKRYCSLVMLTMSLGLTAIGYHATAQSGASVGKCGGLHAGLRAEFVAAKQGVTEPPHVMLSFILLNDSDDSIDAVDGGWVLVIDGAEVRDSGMVFGNGPEPVGGWGTLKPGESYEFGKGLPLTQYFPHAGQYRISWKGKHFQSSTIKIRLDGQP
jgi:hypothetical protein